MTAPTFPAFHALTDARAATCAHCGNHAWLPPENDRSESSRLWGAWCSSACAAALDVAARAPRSAVAS